MNEDSIISPETIQNILKTVVAATKSSNCLPKLGENYELYASYPIFADFLKTEGERVLNLMTNIFQFAEAKINVSNTKLLDELCERLEKANDAVAERLANFIDEAEGRRKQDDLVLIGKDVGKIPFINTSWNKRIHAAIYNAAGASQLSSSSVAADVSWDKTALLLASKNVVRPQIQFRDTIDNVNRPFTSKLRFKHNARMAEKSKISMIIDDLPVNLSENSEISESKNPYKYELDHFEPFPWQLERRPITGIDQAEFFYVDTEEKLDELIGILKSCQEFAVDLEHHSYRSFQGLTCLLQISTRRCDYIVDTLKLWRSVHKLNDPFSDSQILKIFHGADCDIHWLQRDFGVYVVNMFDTGQAMRVLGLARFSLAFLVKNYLKKDLDKQFQLADWRIRPLPPPLIKYAREDTRFLLTCYDRLTNDLLDQGNEFKNLLKSVYERSRDLCATHYEKPLFFDDDYRNLYNKSRKILNSRQIYALKHLYLWRDKIARVEDESLAYVLPDHMLLQIAEVLPKEMQGILACCNPVPPLVRQELHELHRIILRARESLLETPKFEPVVQQVISRHPTVVGSQPHDFAHSSNDEELVPLSQRICKFLPVEETAQSTALIKSCPDLFALVPADIDRQDKSPSKKLSKKIEKIHENFSRTPYEMYIEAKIAENILEKEKNQKENQPKSDSQDAGRRMYSHLSKFDSKPNVTFAEKIETEEKEENFDDSQILSEPPMKKRKRNKEINSADVQPFDYEAEDKKISEEMSKKREEKKSRQFFNPDKDFLAKGKNQNRRKFGNRAPKTGYFKSNKS